MAYHFSKRTFSLAIAALGAGLGLVLAVLLALGAAPPAARAADIDGIDTTADDLVNNGNCTLREAIQAANTDEAVDGCTTGNGADTIHLPAGIYTLTLEGAGENGNATGDLDITSTLIIVGTGAEQTIINANGLDRVLDIRPGAGRVVISGVTIMGGRVVDSDSGGIYNNDAELIMTNTVIMGNSADSAGGGVYIRSGSMMVSGGQISSNSATWGGGVCVEYGTATLSETRIMSNSAGTNGGGVVVGGGSVTLSETRIMSNSAIYSGGGVYLSSGSVLVSGGQIGHNSASEDGGGMCVWSGNATLSGTHVFSNSTSLYGGGVSFSGNSATLNGVRVFSNSAGYGGGVFVVGRSVTLSEMHIFGNSASHDGGGGIIGGDSATISGMHVFSNSAGNNGGGVFVGGGSVMVSGGQVSRNSAGVGGGIFIYEGSATLSGTHIISNSALEGGGVSAWRADVTLGETHIFSNSAPWGSGLYLYDGTIDNMTALTADGDIYQVNGVFNGGDAGLHLDGLLYLEGGTFNAPSTLEISGPFTHTGGTYRQTQLVSGTADVGFPKAGGLILNAGGHDLGRTEVVIRAGQDCTTVAGEAVRHCYAITPTTPATATATFFFNSGELVSNTCDTLDVYHWDGVLSTPLTVDERQCADAPYFVRATGVAGLPPFVLKSGGAPTPWRVYLPLVLSGG